MKQHVTDSLALIARRCPAQHSNPLVEKLPCHGTQFAINCCRQTLEAELKLTRDDCHRVTLELQERRLRVSRLEAKFGVLSSRSKSLYEEEEPKSQAYYVIKNAQEREELQKRGDTLDSENKRLEREVRGMKACF